MDSYLGTSLLRAKHEVLCRSAVWAVERLPKYSIPYGHYYVKCVRHFSFHFKNTGADLPY